MPEAALKRDAKTGEYSGKAVRFVCDSTRREDLTFHRQRGCQNGMARVSSHAKARFRADIRGVVPAGGRKNSRLHLKCVFAWREELRFLLLSEFT
jgi:hypothetical protein